MTVLPTARRARHRGAATAGRPARSGAAAARALCPAAQCLHIMSGAVSAVRLHLQSGRASMAGTGGRQAVGVRTAAGGGGLHV